MKHVSRTSIFLFICVIKNKKLRDKKYIVYSECLLNNVAECCYFSCNFFHVLLLYFKEKSLLFMCGDTQLSRRMFWTSRRLPKSTWALSRRTICRVLFSHSVLHRDVRLFVFVLFVRLIGKNCLFEQDFGWQLVRSINLTKIPQFTLRNAAN